MKTTSSELPRGMSAPTRAEIQAVSRYMGAYYKSLSSKVKFMCPVLITVGLILVLGLLPGASEEVIAARVAAAVVGLGMILLGGSGLKKQVQCGEMTRLFREGQFTVLHGSVAEITLNSQFIGVMNASFRCPDGTVLEKTYEVRQEGLEVGTPLLLVHFEAVKPSQKSFTWAFTPFMLTEEGAKKHR